MTKSLCLLCQLNAEQWLAPPRKVTGFKTMLRYVINNELINQSLFLSLQVNFVASELLALAFSVCYRLYLRPSDVGSSARHAVAAGVGLVLGFFCFGK